MQRGNHTCHRADRLGQFDGYRYKEIRRVALLYRPTAAQQNITERTLPSPDSRWGTPWPVESKDHHDEGSESWLLAHETVWWVVKVDNFHDAMRTIEMVAFTIRHKGIGRDIRWEAVRLCPWLIRHSLHRWWPDDLRCRQNWWRGDKRSRCQAREAASTMSWSRHTFERKQDEFEAEICDISGPCHTQEVLQPDPAKIEAIKEMRSPTVVTGVQRLNSFVNYLTKFLPGLSYVMEPIRQLTRKNVTWNWSNTHERAIEKSLVSGAIVLCFYDHAKEITVQCDASQTGIGAALLQEGQQLAFASRALTDEIRYAQIKTEMLAVVWRNSTNIPTAGRWTSLPTTNLLNASSRKTWPMHQSVCNAWWYDCRNAMSSWCMCQERISTWQTHFREHIGRPLKGCTRTSNICACRRTRPHIRVPTWGDTHRDGSRSGDDSSETDYPAGLARREVTRSATSAPLLRKDRRTRSIRGNRLRTESFSGANALLYQPARGAS